MTEVEDTSQSHNVAKDDLQPGGQKKNETKSAMDIVKKEDTSENVASVKDSGQNKTETVTGDADADGDSEAETWIQSPEKKRGLLENPPILQPSKNTGAKDEGNKTTSVTDSGKKTRKRKRAVDEVEFEVSSLVSSPASSPLSSPMIHPRSRDSDSEASNRSVPRSARSNRAKRNIAKAESVDGSTQAKTRRRRPSDIMPPGAKHKPKGHSNSVDAGTSERRETRSATYPRHSDDDRSPSPRPASRREHKRGVSTQLTSGDFERKKRGRPPLINTRRNRSADRAKSSSSDDSSSPPRNRPSLNKFSSHDQDAMSPAKLSGPRKFKDKNGRTLLSRACNNDDLERAKTCLADRPEDVNVPDNAGNTPLQIAALEGFVDIVKFLLENGAEVDTRNIDKETPLIDAVENGHFEVIKLLLSFGANPRLGNARGDEPFDLVPHDDENYKAIRKLISEAKEHDYTKRRRSNDNQDGQRGTSSRAASTTSARDSPPIIGPRSPPAAASRRRTGRSEVTRNDLLWQANTQENLKLLASKGNVQGVANILNILSKADTESVIAAAKAGHDEVLNYLLAMGDADPDPPPVPTLKPGFNTPMLAAIGKTNPEVIKLLVEQGSFNPTKKFRGKTYYEIAAERRGQHWEKEFDILKTAYDKYTTGKGKTTSPRKVREKDASREKKLRRSTSPVSANLRHSSSPTMMHKGLPLSSPRLAQKERKRDDGQQERRKVSTSAKPEDDSAVAIASDEEQSVTKKRVYKHRRSQSDADAPVDLEADSAQRRRRLVTGAEHRRQRSTVASSTSEIEETEVKRENQTPGLKRTRASMSPEPGQTQDGDAGRINVKKRRTVPDSSPEESRSSSKRKASATSEEKKDVEMKDVDTTAKVPNEVNEPSIPQKRRKSQQKAGGETQAADVEAGKSDVTETQTNAPDTTQITEANISKPATPPPVVDPGPTEEEKAEMERKKQEEAVKAAEAARIAEEKRIAAEKAERERKAAEEAEAKRKAEEQALAKKREEEQRQERIKRELEEQQRRQEEQIRLQALEIERRRREALPAALCRCALMLDAADPLYKTSEWLGRFLPLYTVRTKQLEPESPSPFANDEWIPNFQAAVLLATKDLKLAQYTMINKRAVRPTERDRLWKVARQMLSYEYVSTGMNTSVKQAVQREEQERPKFYAMSELYWVKFSDFEGQVAQHTHLASLQLKKQPISLRSLDVQALESPPPQLNGIKHDSPQMSNGIYPSLPGALYANIGSRV